MARVLCVYYSRTGRTRRAVQALARKLDCDFDELRERNRREGPLGYLSAVIAGAFGKRGVLIGARQDPSAYELVILATPVWSGAVSVAMRTYLREHASVLPEVAFLVTCGGAGAEDALEQLGELANRNPVASAKLDDANFSRNTLEEDLLDFIARIENHLRLRNELPVTPSDAAPPPMM